MIKFEVDLINNNFKCVTILLFSQECTLAEFEYQVEELLFRMNALAGTTNLPEKPTGYLTDSDQSQAIGDDGISSGGSEVSLLWCLPVLRVPVPLSL